jgi:hypothetical protein
MEKNDFSEEKKEISEENDSIIVLDRQSYFDLMFFAFFSIFISNFSKH